MSTPRPSTWQAATASTKKSVSQSDYIMLSMVYSSKTIFLLILSVLASNLSCEPAFADDRKAIEQMFGQFSGQEFRDSFFSEQIRQSSSMDDLDELERKWSEERTAKKELRRQRDAIEEKDKLERGERNKQMFDRSEDLSKSSKWSGSSDSSNSPNNGYSTPILDNDFTFNFEKHVLQSDLFSAKAKDSDHSGHYASDWLQLMHDLDDRTEDDRSREDRWACRDRAKLPGRVIEVTGDWVPDKLDPASNGGFTISPDNGSPVPYKLNGHVDIQRGRPWNDND